VARPKETFAFLCAVLSRAPPGLRREALGQAVATGRLSWPWLVRLASEHQVAPGVHAALARCGLAEHLPADLLDFFEAMAALNRERNLNIRSEALALAGLLNGLAVTPVFLKGGAELLSGLGRDPGERPLLDLDVLVPAQALGDCVRLLQRHGYVSQLHTDSPLSHHAAPLWRKGDVAAIELHADVLAYPFGALLPADEVRRTARPVAGEGMALAVPSPLARVVHAVAHAQLVDLGLAYGRLELRSLLDVACLAERHGDELDWEGVQDRFARHRQAAALGVFLHAARRLVGAPLPEPPVRSRVVALLCRRALWQAGAPRAGAAMARLLRPPLLLSRSLSHRALRRQLVRNLVNPLWLKRHLRQLLG